jgi:hypothetical protein
VSPGCCVNFFEGRHPTFRELVFGPAANDAHPLWRRGSRRLLLQHPQPIRERRHAIPAQLQVIIQAAAYEVNV